MQLGPASRNNLILIVLFALAFGAVLFYVNASSHAQGVVQQGSAQTAVAIPAPEIEPPHGGDPANSPDGPQSPPAQAPVAEAQAPAPSPSPALTEQETQNLQRWSNQVVSSHAPATRGSAIRELAAVKNQESLRALTYALTSDEEPDNRILAVTSLNSLAREGYEVNTVRDALRLAAADTDENVADHAKEAYDELMRKDEAPKPVAADDE